MILVVARIRAVVCIGLALTGLSTIGHGQSVEQSALVNLRWSAGSLDVTGITVYDGKAKIRRDGRDGDEVLSVFGLGGLLSTQVLYVPDRLFGCFQDPGGDTLTGGSRQLDEVFFSTQIPWVEGPMELEFGPSKQRVILDPQAFGGQKMMLPTNKIIDNGPDDQRLVFAVLGDGYQAGELAQFHADAAAVMAGFLNEEPWREYATFVNVYTVDVVSNQSGADHPFQGTFVDTALDASYNFPPIERLLTVNLADTNAAAASVPTHDLVLVIVNDPQYGGSGGSVSVVSTDAAAVDIAIHEVGHTFARLADEYDSPCPSCGQNPVEPNVTDETMLGAIPWSVWIDGGTPLPTPDTPGFEAVVGLFEGAKYQPLGVYRPKRNCMMRSLNFGFCEVCRETHILELYSTLGIDPILSAAPDTMVDLEYSPGGTVALSVDLHMPVTHNLSVAWYLDGTLQPGQTSPTLFLTTSGLSGTHSVAAAVIDPTAWVRNDPLNYLDDSISWTLVEGAGIPGPIDMPHNLSGIYEEGDRLELTIPDPFSAAGPVQWSKNGAPMMDGARVQGAQTRTLVIEPLVLSDTANYSVTYDTGSKAPAQLSNVTITVVPIGSLPLSGLVIGGVVMGLFLFSVSRRAR